MTSAHLVTSDWLASFFMNTDTPRTNAESVEVNETARDNLCETWTEAVNADFARKLERENIELRSTVNTLHKLCVSAETRALKKLKEDSSSGLANDQGQTGSLNRPQT